LPEGAHTLNISVGNPNGNVDENPANNDVYSNFVVNVTGFDLPLVQGFEDVTPFPYAGYSIYNPDAELTWEKTELAAKTGGSSMYINTFNITDIDEYDEISLPAYNMTGITTAHLDFDVANAAYSTDEDFSDTLTVFVSSDCGITWTGIYKKFKPDLATTTPTGGNFIPTNTQWRTESVDLTPFLADKLIIKFKSTSNWENNTFIDNINMNSGTVDVEDYNTVNFSVYPVPANDLLNIQFYLAENNTVRAEIFNSTGEKMMEEELSGRVGNNTNTLLLNDLIPGYYTIKLITGDHYAIRTFVKQ
ncbi:MAG: T9SS type A sorting domain-containing protein, partial [Chitinophagales bacterium]|nr:T9SS type A sorting domain-containing protein [Chitinophagales bacterium]